MGRFIIGAILGLVVGGVITFFVFSGVPGSAQKPGTPILPPDEQQRSGTTQIVLTQDFLNKALAAIFRDMNTPTFQLASLTPSMGEAYTSQPAAFQECPSQITILKEGSGVQTGLTFDNGRIKVPLAFSGSYNSTILGCLRFSGWSQTGLELRFDPGQQTVFGTINVETVNIDGINPLFNGIITPVVQGTLNSRVNPVKIIDGKQIAIDVPITSAGGKLEGSVDDVRADLSNNALNLYIAYTFAGAPGL